MSERAAIVTGASRGIGRAIAEALAEDGYSLTISARKPETLETTAAEFRDKGYDVEPVAANMAERRRHQERRAAAPRALRPARRSRQQRRGWDWRRGRRAAEQIRRHADRRQPAGDHPLLPRVRRDVARRGAPNTARRWLSTSRRSRASPASPGCRSTRRQRPGSSATPRR